MEHHVIDVLDPASYRAHLNGCDIAICTLGVGQPTKVDRAHLVRIDHNAVLGFATACKAAGVRHFLLLSSIGAHPGSRSFYLRTKGELEDGLEILNFERLSLFQPSMILTPTNRYGLSQALTLALWPRLHPILIGPLAKFRGVPVDILGQAIAASAHVKPAPRCDAVSCHGFPKTGKQNLVEAPSAGEPGILSLL